MSRIVLIGLVVVSVLIALGMFAKKNKHPYIATALFTAAAMYTTLLVLGFTGVI